MTLVTLRPPCGENRPRGRIFEREDLVRAVESDEFSRLSGRACGVNSIPFTGEEPHSNMYNLPSGKLTVGPWKSPIFIEETNLPTPMTARVYVNLPEGMYHLYQSFHISKLWWDDHRVGWRWSTKVTTSTWQDQKTMTWQRFFPWRIDTVGLTWIYYYDGYDGLFLVSFLSLIMVYNDYHSNNSNHCFIMFYHYHLVI